MSRGGIRPPDAPFPAASLDDRQCESGGRAVNATRAVNALDTPLIPVLPESDRLRPISAARRRSESVRVETMHGELRGINAGPVVIRS
jgi:hypothetical protein